MYPAGCYIVNGKKYINKLEAYRTALTNGNWPHWDFFEEQFSKKNWTVEPKESLIELYNRRARTIRNEYDYIICWFTGGGDSDNMVHSFLSQGLHIDEIWHRSTMARHSRRDDGLDAFNAANETRLAVIPRLKEYQSLYPWWRPKVNIFDITELSIKLWQEGERNPYSTNYYNPVLPGKENSELLNSKSLKGKKICKLVGIDKPIVRYYQDKFWVSFLDDIVHSAIMQQSRNNKMDQDVCFYWHPDAADIVIKQAHTIVSWFRMRPHLLSMLDVNSVKYSQRQKNEIIKNIIYPFWHSDRWQHDKVSGGPYNEEYYWFYSNADNLSVINWRNTVDAYGREIKKIYSFLPEENHNFKTIKDFIMLPGNYSKWYLIG
jgi:hypothetical protein